MVSGRSNFQKFGLGLGLSALQVKVAGIERVRLTSRHLANFLLRINRTLSGSTLVGLSALATCRPRRRQGWGGGRCTLGRVAALAACWSRGG